MEKMFSRFAPDREPSGGIRARSESPLNRLADRHILVLNPLSNGDAREVSLPRPLRDVGEVEIEDDLSPISPARDYQVGIHDPFIPVDHEVGIDPVIESAGALANGACLILGALRDHGALLQAKSISGFDRVM